jgi:hypothetical protein
MAATGSNNEIVAATPIMVFQFIGLDFRISHEALQLHLTTANL